MLEALKTCDNEERLSELLNPANLFQDAGDLQQIYDEVRRSLEYVARRADQTLVEVGDDHRVDYGLLVPQPILVAIRTVARREGWGVEAVLQGLAALGGWMENVGRGLHMTAAELHSRKATIPGMYGAPPSSRKSSLHKFLIWELLANAPDPLTRGGCISNDSTLRGHRTSFFNYQRSGLCSAEISEVYEGRHSDKCSRMKKASRSHLCKWLHGEMDRSSSGVGLDDNTCHLPARLIGPLSFAECITSPVSPSMPTHHRTKKHTYLTARFVVKAPPRNNAAGYSFFHLIAGQVELVKEAVHIGQHGELGFSKRIHLVFQSSAAPDDVTQNTKAAVSLLQGFVDWMSENAFPRSGRTQPDKFAFAVLDHINNAVKDHLDAHRLGPAWREKLDYRDTELLRWASFCMRIRQCLGRFFHSALGFSNVPTFQVNVTVRRYLGSLTPLHRALEPGEAMGPSPPSVDCVLLPVDVMFGFHAWMRQLHYYAALIQETAGKASDVGGVTLSNEQAGRARAQGLSL